jgi:aminotransferase
MRSEFCVLKIFIQHEKVVRNPMQGRLSRRILSIGSPGIRDVLQQCIAAEAKGKRIIKLVAGDPDFPTPDRIKRAAKEAIDDGWTHYPPHVGLHVLREALAEKFRKHNRIDVNAANVLVSAGSSGCGANSILATIEPGDEVIIPDPAFYNYEAWVRLAGGVPVRVPRSSRNLFAIEAEQLKRRVTDRTRMIILNSPCNPTGHVISETQLDAIADLATKRDLLVISDEVYENILYDGAMHLSIASISGMNERTITINSFSKTYSMTGWRMAYLAAPEWIVDSVQKLSIYNAGYPSTFVQKAAVMALSSYEAEQFMLDAFGRRRKILLDGLSQAGFTCVRPDGAIYVFASPGAGVDSVRFVSSMIETVGVAAVPGVFFGPTGEGWIRFTLTAPDEEIEEAMRRLSVMKIDQLGASKTSPLRKEIASS